MDSFFLVSTLLFICGVFIGALTIYFYYKNKAFEKVTLFQSESIKFQAEVQNIKTTLNENEKLLIQSQIENRHLQEKYQSQKNEFLSIQQQFTDKFENLAQKIFDEKSKKFSEQNISSLKNLLDPVKDQLKSFEKRVEDSYSTERVERGTLKGEINKLIELNLKMTGETENLTRALKGDSKTQGYWGEMILENILSRSGLRKDEEFFLQGGGMALRDSEQNLLKPDVLIKLPENKFIIIDSKVSLTAFESYINSENTFDNKKQTDEFAKEHLDSLKRHIDTLSAKKYHFIEDLHTPELTLLFMPVEPALILALKLQPDLLLYAWDKQIALISPTTLLATLRTISSLWTQDRQTKNTLEIAKSGGQLYEKFVGLLTDLHDLGQRLDQASNAYNETLSKLSTGKGSLIRQVERLKTLGAKTEKNILDHKIQQRLPIDTEDIKESVEINSEKNLEIDSEIDSTKGSATNLKTDQIADEI